MPTLPNMGMVTPTPGADSGTWDDKINACFVQVDEHDHTSGKGVPVPVAGLDIDDDLPMGGFFITGLGKISFSTIAAPTTGSKNLFVSSADNELYWRTNSGTNVKLTNGTSINTTLVGGIVGDYSSVGASVSYEDSNKRYKLLTQTGTWARLATGPVRIYEYNTSESVYVEHAAAAALGASYTVTWAAAVPGSQAAVQMDTSGNLVYSNTFTQDITIPNHPKLTTVQTTHNVVASGQQQGGGGHTYNGGTWVLATTSLAGIAFPLPLRVGDRIKSFTLKVIKNSNGSNTLTVNVFKGTTASGTVSAVTDGGTAITESSNAPGQITITQTFATPVTLAVGEHFYINISHTANPASATDTITAAYATFDRP